MHHADTRRHIQERWGATSRPMSPQRLLKGGAPPCPRHSTPWNAGLSAGLAIALSWTLLGCTVPNTRTAPDPVPTAAAPSSPSSPTSPSTNRAPPPPTPEEAPGASATPKSATPAEQATAPPVINHRGARVSASVGEPGGVVLLWTRIIPADDSPEMSALATKLQSRLGAITRRASPNRPIDQRPAPERACPQAGCQGTAVSALLVHQGKGCAAVLLLGPPGRTPVRLIPWAGRVSFKEPTAAFRSPPESQVIVEDFVTCDGLIDALAAREAEIEGHIKALVGP